MIEELIHVLLYNLQTAMESQHQLDGQKIHNKYPSSLRT